MKRWIKLVALLSVAMCAIDMEAGEQKRSKSPDARGRVVERGQAGKRSKSVVKGSVDFEARVLRFLGRDFYVPEGFLEQCFLYKGEVAQKGKFDPKESTLIDEIVGGRKKVGFDITRPVAMNFNLEATSADDPVFLAQKKEIEDAIELMLAIATGQRQIKEVAEDKMLLMVAKLADGLGNLFLFERIKEAVMDRLLESACPVRTFAGHDRWVNGVVVLPGGNQFLSCSNDKTIKLWDVNPQQGDGLVRTFAGHDRWVWSVAVLPGGNQFLSCSNDKTIKLWDVNPQQGDGLVRTFAGHDGNVNGVAVLPGGNQFLSCSNDKTIKLWNVNPQQGDGLVRTFAGHDGWVIDVVVLPGGNQFLSCSDDNTIKLWNVNEGQERTFAGHNNWVRSVAVLPGGNQFLSCSNDDTIKLWNVNEGQVRTFAGHGGIVNGVAVLPGGNQFLSCSNDETIKLWNVNPFSVLDILEFTLCVRMLTSTTLFDLDKDGEIFEAIPEYLQQALIEKMLANVTRAKELIHLLPEQFDLCRRILLSKNTVKLEHGSADNTIFMSLPEDVRTVFIENKKVNVMNAQGIEESKLMEEIS